MSLDRPHGSSAALDPRGARAGGAPVAEAVDCRCACGSLVARLVTAGVELKCRRCKRTLVVPLEGAARAGLVESGP